MKDILRENDATNSSKRNGCCLKLQLWTFAALYNNKTAKPL